MALTRVAKNGLGLILTIAIVGGGIYGFKFYRATHPAQEAEVVPAVPVTPADDGRQDPNPGSAPAHVVVQDPTPAPMQPAPAPAPVPDQTTQTNTTSNAGMNFLLNAGKK
jgi:hypothetical protein